MPGTGALVAPTLITATLVTGGPVTGALVSWHPGQPAARRSQDCGCPDSSAIARQVQPAVLRWLT